MMVWCFTLDVIVKLGLKAATAVAVELATTTDCKQAIIVTAIHCYNIITTTTVTSRINCIVADCITASFANHMGSTTISYNYLADMG